MFNLSKGQAKLPEDLEEATIATMLPGDTAYTVHWAMWADGDRNCWLNPEFTIRSEPGGTMCMRVHRQRDGGFEVWIDRNYGHKYTLNQRSGVGIPTDVLQFPVAKLHR